MEYEISIQAIIIGVLKKWKQMLVIFIVVFGALMAKNIYSAAQSAEANNKKADEVATGYAREEKTVTTASKEILTVSQLNQRIKTLKQNIEYYNNINTNSPKMKADINNVYNYCRSYYIKLLNTNEVDGDIFLQSVVSSLNNYIIDEGFKNQMSSVSDVLDLDYLSDVFLIEIKGMTVNINIRYLEKNSAKRLMSIAEPLLTKKMDELQSSTERFTYSLTDTTEYTFADASLLSFKSNNDVALSNARNNYEALRTLAMTVEREDQIGDTENVESEVIQKVSWQSKLSKKSILIALFVGLGVAVIIVGIWVMFFSKKLQSVYEVIDILQCPILDVEFSNTAINVISKIQYKAFKNNDLSLVYARIKKGLNSSKKGRLIVEAIGMGDDSEYFERIAKEIAASDMKVLTLDECNSRAEYLDTWQQGDKCVFVINMQDAVKKEIKSRLVDLQSAGVEIVGSFVLLQ